MMGHKYIPKTGYEYDCVGNIKRQPKSGLWSYIKKTISKRIRRETKKDIINNNDEKL